MQASLQSVNIPHCVMLTQRSLHPVHTLSSFGMWVFLKVETKAVTALGYDFCCVRPSVSGWECNTGGLPRSAGSPCWPVAKDSAVTQSQGSFNRNEITVTRRQMKT